MRRAYHAFSVVFLLAVIVAAIEFFLDDDEAERLSRAAACAGSGAGCVAHAQLTRLEKTPLSRQLDYRVGGRVVQVRCVRALVLVGDLACALR